MSAPGLYADVHRSFAAALAHDDPATARRNLLDAGWLDALEADEAMAVAIVFRVQGARPCHAGVLDDVMIKRLAPSWPVFDQEVAVTYPIAGRGRSPSGETHAVFAARRDVSRILYVSDTAGEAIELLELTAPLEGRSGLGVEADGQLLMLTGYPRGTVVARLTAEHRNAWDEALAAGRVALAHQLVSSASVMLHLAVEHARNREQFGEPIGAFQAVKHRLADAMVAISAANAAAVAAATTMSQTAAAVAKALAGRAADRAATHCLQVLGGIGFTAEHRFHRYFRHHLVLDRLLGDHHEIARELGGQLRSGALDAERVVTLADPFQLELFETLTRHDTP